MPSPLDFLWAGVVLGVVGKCSITSVKCWLSAFIVTITSAICALKSVLRSVVKLVMVVVSSVRSSVTSWLIILVKSSLISAIICSRSAFAFMELVVLCWMAGAGSGIFGSPL